MTPMQKEMWQSKDELLARIAEINKQVMITKAAKKAAMQEYNDTLRGYQEELEGALEQLKNTKETTDD